MTNLIANRKLARLSAIVLALGVGATIPAAQAIGQTNKVSVNIPFDFQNGSEHLRAGSYTIGMASAHILLLQGTNTASMALSRVEFNSAPAARGKVVFTRYGSRYFLREVWQANKGQHQVLPKTKAEKRQQNAMNVTERNGTEVALLEPFK